MDARPVRGRGVENAAPPLHQRHKSAGNLIGMAAASLTGFRGPAKRAAFGDVTNLAKNVGVGRDEAKAVKIQAPVASTYVQPLLVVNKENASYVNDARPAQRPVSSLSTKPRLSNESRLTEQVRNPVQAGDAHSHVRQVENTNTNTEVAHQYPINAAEAVPPNRQSLQPVLNSLPAQPRHYKSQPQLKLQQPTLRKTQSRQFEKTDSVLSEIKSAVVLKDEESIPLPQLYQVEPQIVHHASSQLLIEPEVQVDVTHGEQLIESHVKLADISEEPALALISQKRASVAGLSEPEEYWEEEDDEEYDDQDQAYTTAHSFRSRGDMTTGGATTMIAPRVTARVQRELEEARLEVEQTHVEDIEEEMWDVTMVTEYGEEIFEYMRELEMRMLPNPHYMEAQTEIQWSMRSVLMDWLVQVHNRFNLLPETLFLTVNYIDRFLTSKIVSIGKLQLVGATAILVASKYEEINCPSLEEIVYMVDGGYTIEEILKAERFMLSMLSFELGWPGPMSFLRRVSKADDYDLETRTLAKYFLELTIMDERFVASPPSFLAAGAHCLSRLILDKGDWSKPHVHYSRYTWNQLKPLVSMMIECCECPRQHHSAIFEKYQERRFKGASTVVQEALDSGFVLPHQQAPVRRLPEVKATSSNGASRVQYLDSLLVST